METLRKVKQLSHERIFYIQQDKNDIFFRIQNLDSAKNKIDAITNCNTKLIAKLKKMKEDELINFIIEFFIDKSDLI